MNERYALCRGFSLIELTVVLLLITLIASVAVRETSELAFQARYEQTKERLELIKQAILGNPRQIVNGQQAISGFVADMGRLPVNLRELVDNSVAHSDCDLNATFDSDGDGDATHDVCRPLATGNCYNNVNAWLAFFNAQNCMANNVGNVWLNNPGNLAVGWHGPYLSINGSAADNDALTDGWGRAAENLFYGWRYEQGLNPLMLGDANAANDQTDPQGFVRLVVQSLGKDQSATNSLPSNDYIDDYPPNTRRNDAGVYYPNPIIDKGDWLIDISSGISVSFAKRFSANAYCGFLDADKASFDTAQKCENAGGTYSGGACTAINETSCKSVGGKWQSCFFSPVTCVTVGGTSTTECQFSKKSCIAAAGNAAAWDGTNNVCKILTESPGTYCTNANGSWNGTTCSFSVNSCALAGGAWVQDCSFTASACTAAGGTNDAALPASCGFTQANCELKNGVSNNSDCYMSHAESVGTRYVANSCQGALGKWTGQICMNVFYRDAATMTIKTASSQRVSIDENGAFSSQLFTGFNIGGVPVNLVPAGQNAIGIYEWDGDCDPVNNLYPPDRQNPIPVEFRAHTTLPVINW